MSWTAGPFLALALTALTACATPLPTQPTPGPAVPALITFAGVISDSETNAPLTGVTVCFPHEPSCASTAADGSYQFTIDPATLGFSIAPNSTLCPYAFRTGFEGRGICAPIVGNKVSWSTTLQRTIWLDAGQNARATIFKGEGSGVVDSGLCEPCKSFNVRVPASGTLFLQVVADSPDSKLRIEVFFEGFDNGALPITTQREVQVVVHTAVAPASFELVTSFVPTS